DRDDRREDAGRPRVRRNATRAATFAPMSLTFSGLPRIDLRRTSDGADQHSWRARCHRSAGLSGEADHVAREIIAAVQSEGDAAVLRLTEQFEQRRMAAAEM